MTPPLLFCATAPGRRDYERQPAMAAIQALGERYLLDVAECYDRLDYAVNLRRVWTWEGDLINIEHDMGPTPEHIAALLACPHPLCAWSYWGSGATTGRVRPIIAATIDSPSGPRLAEGGEEWALSAGIGLAKLAPSVRLNSEMPRLADWNGPIGDEVLRVVRWAGPWHLHWPPVRHYHGFMELVHAQKAE